jgi:hypothetical protein
MTIFIIKINNIYVYCPFAPSSVPCYMCVVIRLRGLQPYLASGHRGHRNHTYVGPTLDLDLVQKRIKCCSRELNTGRPVNTQKIWFMFWLALTICVTVIIVN